MMWNLRYLECDGCGDPFPHVNGTPKPADADILSEERLIDQAENAGWECTNVDGASIHMCPKCVKKAAGKAARKEAKTMTDYQKSGRVDLAILDALSKSPNPLYLDQVHKHICAEQTWVSMEVLASHAKKLVLDGYADLVRAAEGEMSRFAVTTKGRAHLIADDARVIMNQHLGEEPKAAAEAEDSPELVQVTACNHREPEVPDAAQALLCVDEDELNDWWDALDVEAKADAFVQWSLGNDGRNSHIYIEPAPRPTKMSDDEAAEFIKQHAARIRDVLNGDQAKAARA